MGPNGPWPADVWPRCQRRHSGEGPTSATRGSCHRGSLRRRVTAYKCGSAEIQSPPHLHPPRVPGPQAADGRLRPPSIPPVQDLGVPHSDQGSGAAGGNTRPRGHPAPPSISTNLKRTIKAVLNISSPRKPGYQLGNGSIRHQLLWLRESHLNPIPSKTYPPHRNGIEVNEPENTSESTLSYTNISKLRTWWNFLISFIIYLERPRIKCVRIIICSLGSKFSFKIHFCWAPTFLSPHHSI